MLEILEENKHGYKQYLKLAVDQARKSFAAVGFPAGVIIVKGKISGNN